jgi:hypothetical protein
VYAESALDVGDFVEVESEDVILSKSVDNQDVSAIFRNTVTTPKRGYCTLEVIDGNSEVTLAASTSFVSADYVDNTLETTENKVNVIDKTLTTTEKQTNYTSQEAVENFAVEKGVAEGAEQTGYDGVELGFNGSTSIASSNVDSSVNVGTMYFDIVRGTNDTEVLFALNATGNIIYTTSFTNLNIQTPSGDTNVSNAVAVGGIYKVAMVSNGTQYQTFINGVKQTMSSQTAGLISMTELHVGNRQEEDLPCSGNVKGLVLSSETLTDQQAIDLTNGDVKVADVLPNAEIKYDKFDLAQTATQNLVNKGSLAGQYNLTATAILVDGADNVADAIGVVSTGTSGTNGKFYKRYAKNGILIESIYEFDTDAATTVDTTVIGNRNAMVSSIRKAGTSGDRFILTGTNN